ncbi:AMP-binding protein, partial [Klebsiella pneumoniae]|uniref:AMP-binding protein n=1 Tax=Klebsiella pneumoniae TaxID=573 RepID=UPI003A84C277
TADRFKTSDYHAMLAAIWPGQVPTLELVVTLGEVAPAGMRRWAELGRAPDRAALARAEADLDADDPINIQFTSGTTGHPKGATLTRR